MGEDEIAPAPVYPAVIDQKRCSGCGRCIAACPERLYSFRQDKQRKYAVLVSLERCSSCGRCIRSCPLGIIIWQTSKSPD